MADQGDSALPTDLVTLLQKSSTATLSTQLFARGLRSVFLTGPRRLNGAGPRMVGPAFTMRYIPAREDLDVVEVFADYDHPQRRAIETAPAGAVVVIDARGQCRAASLGHILATRLEKRGCAGIVTDGAVRDLAGFQSLAIPSFAAGATPTTNLGQHHAVEHDVPIGCGEVAVFPGDVMVGDEDGVICIPRHLAAEVAEAAAEQEELEAFIQARVAAGSPLRGTYPANDALLAEYRASRT